MKFSLLFAIVNLIAIACAQKIVEHNHDLNIDYENTNTIINRQSSTSNSQSSLSGRQSSAPSPSHTRTYSYEHRSYQSDKQMEPVPVRWRTTHDDSKLNFDTNNYIQEKHEDLRRRTIRMRTLTTTQNTIQKELESNETILGQQSALENPDLRTIQNQVNLIRDCMTRWERVQTELQKLYRDQIQEEKTLLEFYRINKPTDLETHKHLQTAIERWELIYNQLLDMQLNEKRKNVERERNFDRLLTELDYKINESKLSTLNTDYTLNTPSKQQQTHYTFTPSYSHHEPIHSSYSSYSSSSSSSSSDGKQNTYSYSSSSKSNGLDKNHQNVVFSSNQANPNSYLSIQSPTPVVAKTIVDDQEANSLIFRVPESSPLRNIKCLSKWFDDLGKEDADWIRRSQLKNEKLFDEIVKMQKAQWDTLKVEHDKKKEQHIPKTFKCELKNKDLCDQEEANFNKMFNEYRVEKYPSKQDQLSNQQSNQYQLNQQQQMKQNQQSYYPQVYNQIDTYQSQQRQPSINGVNQKVQRVN